MCSLLQFGVSRRLIAVSVIAGASVLVGCGDQAERASKTQDQIEYSAFLDRFEQGAADFDPAESPSDLGERAKVIVEGTITGFERGRTYGKSDEDPEAAQTAVMTVAVEQAVKSDPQEGEVHVELLGVESPEDYQAALPKGNRVLLYLNPVPDEGLVPGPVSGEGAGYPPGTPLYSVVNPQGFLLETPGGVAEPQEGALFRDASLRAFYPERTHFPPE